MYNVSTHLFLLYFVFYINIFFKFIGKYKQKCCLIRPVML
ncbi:conserved protein of unknown function [Clostridium phage phiCD24-1]|nr:conserved protein of unknown function [Clostridium phage phiCD24-1]